MFFLYVTRPTVCCEINLFCLQLFKWIYLFRIKMKEIFNILIIMQIFVCFLVPIRPINPYIRHWESAKFERQILEDAHQSHVFRRKRAIENYHKSYENATFNNEIKLQFNAHNRYVTS